MAVISVLGAKHLKTCYHYYISVIIGEYGRQMGIRRSYGLVIGMDDREAHNCILTPSSKPLSSSLEKGEDGKLALDDA
eukprot:scaffold961_cov122-Cylindrotheca_fusiformis.AAC.30